MRTWRWAMVGRVVGVGLALGPAMRGQTVAAAGQYLLGRFK